MVVKRIVRLYDRVAKNRKNCRFEDLARLLIALGFTVREGHGSHVVFKRKDRRITVPRQRPVKEHYVEEVLSLIADLMTEM